MIRKIKSNDIDRVMTIWLESNLSSHNFVKQDYWISNAETVRDQLLQAETYVYEQSNQIVGFVGMQEDYLAGIFIDKEVRSLGIGKQLLDYIKGIHASISLNVYKENKGAVNFYLREGLSITSEETDEATNSVEYLMQWNANIFSIRK